MSPKQVGRALAVMAIVTAMALAGYTLLTDSRTALTWLCAIVLVGGTLELIVLVLDTGGRKVDAALKPFTLAPAPDGRCTAELRLGIRCRLAPHPEWIQHITAAGEQWRAVKPTDADATVQLPTLAERMIRTDGKTL